MYAVIHNGVILYWALSRELCRYWLFSTHYAPVQAYIKKVADKY